MYAVRDFVRERLRLDDTGRVLLSGALIAFILQGGGAGLRYLSEVVFARWLGSEAYGTYIYVVNWAEFVSVFAGIGLTTATLRFVPGYLVHQRWGKLRGYISFSLFATWAAGLLLLASCLGILGGLDPLPFIDQTTLIVGAVAIPIFAVFKLQSSLLRGYKRISLAELPRNILQPLGAMLALYLLLEGQSERPDLLAVGALTGTLAALIMLQWGFIRVKLPRQIWRSSRDFTDRRLWLKTAFPLLIVAGFHIILYRADVLMVGTLLTAEDAGLYNAAAKTAGLIAFVLTAFNTIVAPLISEHWSKHDLEGLSRTVEKAIRWTFWPSVGLVAAVVIGREAILGVFGEEFLIATPVLLVLAGGQLVNAICGPVGFMMGMTGNEQASAVVFGVSAALNVALNFVLIGVLGLAGAAVATALTMIFWNVVLAYLVRRRLNVDIFAMWARLFRP